MFGALGMRVTVHRYCAESNWEIPKQEKGNDYLYLVDEADEVLQNI